MSTNFQDLDPDSPEYEAAVEAAQAAEDAAREGTGQTEPTAEDEATPEAAESEPAEKTEQTPTEPEAEAEQAAVAEGEAKVSGVASKDGTIVLPYSALQAERRERKRERNAREQAERERDELRKQLEDAKAGKTPEPELTDEELAELAVDVPAVAKLAAERKRLREENEELAKKVPKPAADKEADEDDPILEAFDRVPILLKWRDEDIEKVKRAGVYDDVLKASPKWKDLPPTVDNLAKRFNEAARLVAEEYGIELAERPKTAAPPPPARPDPKTVIDKAPRATPQSLSDFKGGNVDRSDERIEKMSPNRMLARFSEMTDAEIDAHLRTTGGD